MTGGGPPSHQQQHSNQPSPIDEVPPPPPPSNPLAGTTSAHISRPLLPPPPSKGITKSYYATGHGNHIDTMLSPQLPPHLLPAGSLDAETIAKLYPPPPSTNFSRDASLQMSGHGGMGQQPGTPALPRDLSFPTFPRGKETGDGLIRIVNQFHNHIPILRNVIRTALFQIMKEGHLLTMLALLLHEFKFLWV